MVELVKDYVCDLIDCLCDLQVRSRRCGKVSAAELIGLSVGLDSRLEIDALAAHEGSGESVHPGSLFGLDHDDSNPTNLGCR